MWQKVRRFKGALGGAVTPSVFFVCFFFKLSPKRTAPSTYCVVHATGSASHHTLCFDLIRERLTYMECDSFLVFFLGGAGPGEFEWTDGRCTIGSCSKMCLGGSLGYLTIRTCRDKIGFVNYWKHVIGVEGCKCFGIRSCRCRIWSWTIAGCTIGKHHHHLLSPLKDCFYFFCLRISHIQRTIVFFVLFCFFDNFFLLISLK